MQLNFLRYLVAVFTAMVFASTVALIAAYSWTTQEMCVVEKTWLASHQREFAYTNVTVRVVRQSSVRTWAEFCVYSAPDNSLNRVRHVMESFPAHGLVPCRVTPLRFRPEIVAVAEGGLHLAPQYEDVPGEFAVIVGFVALYLTFILVAMLFECCDACFDVARRYRGHADGDAGDKSE